MRTLIRNGTVVTASAKFAADVLVDGTKIAAVVQPGMLNGLSEIDARGMYVLPGGVDAHTHLDLPVGDLTSSDDFETGTIAAAYGGTTTIIDFANQARGASLRAGIDDWHQKAEGRAVIDYGFHVIVTDTPPAVLAEMAEVVSEGITSFKLFMAYPDRLQLDDGAIFRTLLRARELHALVSIHAENGPAIDILVAQALQAGHTDPIYHALTRPEASEATAVERALALAEMAQAPIYLVHLTTARALEHIRQARWRGQVVFGETCPQYLCCSEDDLRGQPEGVGLGALAGAKFVCSPPLRTRANQESLWQALAQHEIQVVATDHCPFNMAGEKDRGRGSFAQIPNGMPAIETRLHLLWEGVRQGRLSMERFVDLTATEPARIFGLYPHKGTIAVGADADLVIWDPEKRLELSQRNLHMRVDYSPYEGKVVIGAPRQVMSRGELIIDQDKFLGRPGRGQFLKRRPYSG